MSAELLTQVILPVSLFLIMLGMGLSLKTSDFSNIIRTPKAIAVGLSAQLVLLPLVAFLIAIILQLPPEIAVGLIIIALAPGGATSNMYSYLFKGDVSLSISMTAVVSLITPFTIPILAALSMSYFMAAQTDFTLPIGKTIVQLLVITVIPVAIGMLLLAKAPMLANRIEKFLKWFSVAFLALIIVLIVLQHKQHMQSYFAESGLATLILNVVVLMLGYHLAKLAKLPPAQSVSIGFEVGIQNGTLALLVAGTLIGNEVMMIPAITYALIMFATGTLFGFWIKSSNQKDTSLKTTESTTNQ